MKLFFKKRQYVGYVDELIQNGKIVFSSGSGEVHGRPTKEIVEIELTKEQKADFDTGYKLKLIDKKVIFEKP